MILPNYFQDPNTLHVNTIEHHAYFIPHKQNETALSGKREQSDYFTLLNGQWDFNYFQSYHDLPDNFLDVAFEHKIPVPANWQNHGFDHHHYTNINYPFPFDPPFVPAYLCSALAARACDSVSGIVRGPGGMTHENQ